MKKFSYIIRCAYFGIFTFLSTMANTSEAGSVCSNINIDSVGYVKLRASRIENIAEAGGQRPVLFVTVKPLPTYDDIETGVVSEIDLMADIHRYDVARCRFIDGNKVNCALSLMKKNVKIIVKFSDVKSSVESKFQYKTKIIAEDIANNVLNCH